MIVESPQLGIELEFPDGTPEQVIQQTFLSQMGGGMEGGMGAQGAGGFMAGISGFLDRINQPEPPQVLPNMTGSDVIGLRPEDVVSLNQIHAGAQQESFQQRMQEREMVQQEMEAEKDRAQQIKLENQRLKNQQAQEKLQAELQKGQTTHSTTENIRQATETGNVALTGTRTQGIIQEIEQQAKRFPQDMRLQRLLQEGKELINAKQKLQNDEALWEEQARPDPSVVRNQGTSEAFASTEEADVRRDFARPIAEVGLDRARTDLDLTEERVLTEQERREAFTAQAAAATVQSMSAPTQSALQSSSGEFSQIFQGLLRGLDISEEVIQGIKSTNAKDVDAMVADAMASGEAISPEAHDLILDAASDAKLELMFRRYRDSNYDMPIEDILKAAGGRIYPKYDPHTGEFIGVQVVLEGIPSAPGSETLIPPELLPPNYAAGIR